MKINIAAKDLASIIETGRRLEKIVCHGDDKAFAKKLIATLDSSDERRKLRRWIWQMLDIAEKLEGILVSVEVHQHTDEGERLT